MKKLFFPLILIASFFFFSCENEIIIPDLPDTVSFSGDIIPLFNSKCIGCHGPNASNGLNLNAEVAYNNLMDKGLIDLTTPENSALYQKISAGNHGSVSSVQAASILKWIEQGALEN